MIDSAPLGYLTAYREGEADFDHPLELWPRLREREPHIANVRLFRELEENPPRTLINVQKLLDAWEREAGSRCRSRSPGSS